MPYASSAAAEKEARRRHQLCAWPSRSSTASVTDSSAVSCGKRVLIWKVRTSPLRPRWCGCSPVISSSPRKIAPLSGGSMPVKRLMSVVLPPPLGPIRASRTPLGSSSAMSCATTSEPKLLLSFFVESTQSAEDAVGQEHHHRDQHHADPEIPVLRIDAGKMITRHHVDDGADDAAVEAASGAAQDQDHQHVGRAAEGQRLERHGGSGLR